MTRRLLIRELLLRMNVLILQAETHEMLTILFPLNHFVDSYNLAASA